MKSTRTTITEVSCSSNNIRQLKSVGSNVCQGLMLVVEIDVL